MSFQELQQMILAKHGGQVKENVKRLCQSCIEWRAYGKEGGSWRRSLLPICLDGSDCPYFEGINGKR